MQNLCQKRNLRSIWRKNKRKAGNVRQWCGYIVSLQGIAMLSGLLKNDIAVQVSINLLVLLNKLFNQNSIHILTFYDIIDFVNTILERNQILC